MAKIVVIDDEPGVRRLISRILRRAGHTVVAFEHGKIGIDHLRREIPDLLITDIFMPEMEGLETVKLAHSLNLKMPIIAISGGGSRGEMQYMEFARRFGATATLGVQRSFKAAATPPSSMLERSSNRRPITGAPLELLLRAGCSRIR